MFKNQQEFEKSLLNNQNEAFTQDKVEEVMQNSEETIPNFVQKSQSKQGYSNENSSMNYSNRSTEQRDDYQEKADIREIVAVHKEEGNISSVKLDNGTILSKEEAIELTKHGGIKDMNVGRRGSRETLRKNPVEDANQCLSNMPRF